MTKRIGLQTLVGQINVSPNTVIYVVSPSGSFVTETLASHIKVGDRPLVTAPNLTTIVERTFLEVEEAEQSYATEVESYENQVEELQNLRQLAQKEAELETFDAVGTLTNWMFGHTIPDKLRQQLRSRVPIKEGLARSAASVAYSLLNDEIPGGLDESFKRRIRDWLNDDKKEDKELYEIFGTYVHESFQNYTHIRSNSSLEAIDELIAELREPAQPEIITQLIPNIEAALQGRSIQFFEYNGTDYRTEIARRLGQLGTIILPDGKTIMLPEVSGVSKSKKGEASFQTVKYQNGQGIAGLRYRPMPQLARDMFAIDYVISSMLMDVFNQGLLKEALITTTNEYPGIGSVDMAAVMRGMLSSAVEHGLYGPENAMVGYLGWNGNNSNEKHGQRRLVAGLRAAELYKSDEVMEGINTFYLEQIGQEIDFMKLITLANETLPLVPRDFYQLHRERNREKVHRGRVQKYESSLVRTFGDDAKVLINYNGDINNIVTSALSFHAPEFLFAADGAAKGIKPKRIVR